MPLIALENANRQSREETLLHEKWKGDGRRTKNRCLEPFFFFLTATIMAQRRSAILAQCRSLGPAVFANRTPTHERRKQHNRAQINPAKATKQPPETHQKDQFGPALRLE
ncbi:hypothetical protein LSM04_006211 [Trypanosoma melophagium]|uniref:uncharacterized protein n=1 Tax=Trypanosoma melophagium TaxID=715481 RepID=UPI00351A19D5|nr:hypothetical protein LSM04_006211 [Trypanosoma melophagium]